MVDTNVFISGIFFSGPPYEILNAWRDSKIQLVTTPEILDEYSRVAEELSEQFPEIDISDLLKLALTATEVIVAPGLKEPVCDDADDDKFLACALAGKAKFIVSGDKHLRKVAIYKGIKILTPRRFIDQYLRITREHN